MRLLLYGGALLGLLVYPLVVPPFWTLQIGAQSLFLGIIALSLTLLAGYGGMVSLAQMTVAGLAGYGIALLGPATPALGVTLPWPLAVLGALIFAVAVALFIGAVSVRTSGIYTIMITLAIAMGVFFLTQQNYRLFNGFTGFAQVAAPRIGDLSLRDPIPFFYLCLAVAALATAAVHGLLRTPFGLALQGIRDNPRRMRTLGYAVNLHRVFAFGLAGLVAAAGGILSVWYNQRISPGSIDLAPVIDVLVVAVIGGLYHPFGAFVGALAFTLLDNFASDLIAPERFNTLIGVVFILIILISPDGLTGLSQRLARKGKPSAPVQ